MAAWSEAAESSGWYGLGDHGGAWAAADGWGTCGAVDGFEWAAAGGDWLQCHDDQAAWPGGEWAGVWWGAAGGPGAFSKGLNGSSLSKGSPWGVAPRLTSTDEHTARLHFTKTYQVLAEVLECHPKAFHGASTFLDLGCAPGGFAARLLEELPEAKGFGVTLPVQAGGFPILARHDRLQVQESNLMDLVSSEDVDCPELVDICMADAQDLGRRTNPEGGSGRGGDGRRGRGGRGAAGGKGAGAKDAVPAAGVGASCSLLGIWALTLQELLLAFGRLRDGGTFFFRFGWRGGGAGEEPCWYKEATVRLFAVILTHFNEVAPFKSEFSHQAHSSFYVVASGFRRGAYVEAGLDARLKEIVTSVVQCERATDLPWYMERLAPRVPPEMATRIDQMLDAVGRLRAIGMSSRHRVEAGGPDAALWISPVPFSLTMPRLRERLERFGKISFIRRRSHPVGVGADALVQFLQPAHATAALEAIEELRILGPVITVRRLSDVQGTS